MPQATRTADGVRAIAQVHGIADWVAKDRQATAALPVGADDAGDTEAGFREAALALGARRARRQRRRECEQQREYQ